MRTLSERIFVQALQATTNRMANWSICRSQDFALFAGPQIYPHRNVASRMNVGAIPTRLPAKNTTELFGWLQCSDCLKWRRVSAQALRIWGDKFQASHKYRCKALLQGDAVLHGLASRAISYDAFVEELRDWTRRKSESLCAHTVLLVALELLQEGSSPVFGAQHDEAQQAYTGAAFRCDELVGCVCAMDCDTRRTMRQTGMASPCCVLTLPLTRFFMALWWVFLRVHCVLLSRATRARKGRGVTTLRRIVRAIGLIK